MFSLLLVWVLCYNHSVSVLMCLTCFICCQCLVNYFKIFDNILLCHLGGGGIILLDLQSDSTSPDSDGLLKL